MAFEFVECFTQDGIKFENLYEIKPKIFCDLRGCFFESYNERDFLQNGIDEKFVQDNQSISTKNVLRGLHFQTKNPQAKLVRLLEGKVFDVAVDLRNDSKTFGKYFGLTLDCEKQNMFYIPKGFAHGFYVLSDRAISLYKCTNFYNPQGESGIIWNDSTIAIDWKVKQEQIILSDKDLKHPFFDLNKKYFDMNGNWIGE